jgi:hypothetical protein
LSYIDAAIEHTPTLIELFVTKGRIYKVRNEGCVAGDTYLGIKHSSSSCVMGKKAIISEAASACFIW